MKPLRQPDPLSTQKNVTNSLRQEILFPEWRATPRLVPAQLAGLTTILLLLLVLSLWIPGGQAYAQSCSIALKPTVSGCYQNNGSKATVSVEVTWSNVTVSSTANDPSDAITVTYSGQTRTIDPGPYTSSGSNGTIVSPQVVAFEVDLTTTGSGQTVAAAFSANSGCSANSAGVSLPAACPPTACGGNNVGGKVFNDYNADGVKDSGETSGVSGVTVKAYDCAGALAGTTTTDAFGLYSITSLQASSYPVRVEFSNLPTYAGQGTLKGTDSQTTIQFINAPDCSVDLGLLDPTDYCQSNPKLVIPCYVTGDPLVAGTVASSDAVVAFDYNVTGANTTTLSSHAIASQVGSLWGMAYNKFTRKIFSSATVKRHAGLGPLGLGGIYVSDFSTPPANGTTFSYTNFIDVSTLGINVGSIPNNVSRNLIGDKSALNEDNAGYLAAGQVGIGGIDLSEDGNNAHLTNLHDNKLYEIDITAYNATGALPTPANVKVYDVSAGINYSGGNLHIWAVKVQKGKVYTGFISDARISNSKSDLRAFVQELSGTAVSSVFDFPLTYPKGFPWEAVPNVTGWFPWTDDWATKQSGGFAGNILVPIHPEPILTSIEFDIDGSMVLAFGDRTGIQTGFQNYAPINDNKLYTNVAGGDILRAYSTGTSFVLENNAKAGPNVGYGQNNNQGPGFGEFYNDNFAGNGHAENSLGGLALRPGSGEVICTAMDPLDPGVPGADINAGGIRRLNNQTGLNNSGFLIYTSNTAVGTFGKASSLGDAVLVCDIPNYLEIGNRVWIDSDKDGIQDPCELPLTNVKVALFRGNTLLASTTTNASGEYYFNTTNAPTLLPNTTYSVRFGTDGASDQFDSSTDVLTVNGERYTATLAFSTTATASTLNDSNAQKSGGHLSASVTTGAAGSVNHSIDAGFYVACPLVNCYPTLVSRN